MKWYNHIYYIVKYIIYFIVVMFFNLLGFIVLPIAILFRVGLDAKNKTSNPAERFKSNIIDYIYGNQYDGFGDIYYRRDYPIDTYWSRLNWCLLRNPTHNLGQHLGVNSIIVKSETYGNPNVIDDPFIENMGLKIQIVTDIDNKKYVMYYYCILWRQLLPFYKGDRGLRLLIGHKNFCVKELNKYYEYNFAFVLTPFKNFVKG